MRPIAEIFISIAVGVLYAMVIIPLCILTLGFCFIEKLKPTKS